VAEKKLKVPQHLIDSSSDLLQEIAECIALAKLAEKEAEQTKQNAS
jgi:hypothetical protein